MKITTEEIEVCNSFPDLEKLVSCCERCDLYTTKHSDVFGEGSQKAEVMFIGEAPGKDEDLQGRPFVGRAGQILNQMLIDAAMEREKVYIGNVVKHRPPANRDPLPSEINACWPYLKKQIELLNPKLIVFLGRHAMGRFFPTMRISEVHGKAFRKEFGGRKQVFLALYHPAVAIYNSNLKETLTREFQRIPQIIKKIDFENNNNQPKQEKLF